MRHEPRVLFLAQRLAPHDGRFIKTARSFEEAGYAVSALAPAVSGPAHARVETISAHSTLAAAPGRLGAYLRARALRHALVARAAELRPDLIIVYDPEALPAAVAAKRATGARLIYDAHEFHEAEDPAAPERGAWVSRAELRSAPALDGFVTVNRWIAKLYARRQPGFPEAVVVHNAVGPRPTHPDGRLHARAGVPPDTQIILYQGAFAPMRGLDRLVRAAALLDDPWRVVLMGSGPLEDELRAAADPARVGFAPPVDHGELHDWTADATLGALLYEDVGLNQRYCTPNKLWEYPAAGVPVLASTLPALVHLMRAQGIGFFVDAAASPEAIASRVNAIEPHHLSTARKWCRSFSELYTWSGQVARLITLADRLVGRAPAATSDPMSG